MKAPPARRECRLLIVLALTCALPALADEGQLRLKDGLGHDTVLANCTMCHSVDYVLMNSPFQKQAGWLATVNKMVKALGAPISPEDIPVIVDYLSRNYGVE